MRITRSPRKIGEAATPQGPGKIIGPRPDIGAAWTLVSAGVGRVEGSVSELWGGAPIEDARVEVVETGAVGSTDASGNYRFSLLAGNYTLTFSTFLHEETTLPVTVSHDTTSTLDASLTLRPTQ